MSDSGSDRTLPCARHLCRMAVSTDRGLRKVSHSMRLHFHGAAREVTGSCHRLEIGKSQILLDCGLFQGRRKEAFRKNRDFAFSPAKIDCLVLSHAHIDHSGNIPHLVADGFNGPIYCTHATKDLCEWMLRDSGRIQEYDVQYVNRKRRKQNKKPFEPLYTLKDAVKALTKFRGVDYNEDIEIAPGVQLRFEDAGHILGSASVHLDCDDAGIQKRLVFTGDIGVNERPILRSPVPPKKADLLISECTYGDRQHRDSGDDIESLLLEIATDTLNRGGKLLIPAFSVGRTQRLVYHLNNLFNSGKLPPMPMFVDSPLSTNVTEVFRRHPECYDEDAKEILKSDDDLFGFHRLTYIREAQASKALSRVNASYVLIASSGMCEAGRVVHHLKHIAPDPNSTILAVGYMAPYTLGRRIVEKAKRIRLHGEEYDLKARVETTSGLSVATPIATACSSTSATSRRRALTHVPRSR